MRGPSSALYGTNAYNGVLVLTTKQPRYSEGGTVQLTAGELSTLRGDVRWSTGLTEATYLKVNGSYTSSDDFYLSRNTGVEYSHFCTPAEAADPARNCFSAPEAMPLELNEDKLWLAGVRLDQYFGESFLTVEGGNSYVEGVVVQTGIGRVQILEQDRPWARANFSHPHFNVLSYYNKREAPNQTALASGANLVLDEQNWAARCRATPTSPATKGRVIGGVSYKEEEIDTRNEAGVATLSNPPTLDNTRTAGYAQVEYTFTDKFKALAAGRYDDSDAARRPVLAQGGAGLRADLEPDHPLHLQRGLPVAQLLGVLPRRAGGRRADRRRASPRWRRSTRGSPACRCWRAATATSRSRRSRPTRSATAASSAARPS